MKELQEGISKVFSFIILAIVAAAVILLYQYWLMDLELDIFEVLQQTERSSDLFREQNLAKEAEVQGNETAGSVGSVGETIKEPRLVVIEIWVDNQSYNLSAGTFEAIAKETKEDLLVKVNSSSKFYRAADSPDNREYFNNFVEFYVAAKDVYNRPFTVKGTLYPQAEGISTVVAGEVFWLEQ